ncbi:hypothetical protein COEREDRAFT_89778 [Coemansia reversa NRRL 1564]|uniref:Uncharacterized protein n=1 Tax=Coemansia reversa (strain ATCC 12441 / NRRL 1564) TaxID=763665 RepID=A0A2G5B2I5_COERN|nr:hypothetical protein COEREDRAFT_89778 [Coemansia reversa NRRL 1564]|eukprot:PIA13201.1 hypothetical protein COEREDRAFT_89778 [Coemansia reversa NRRL 1564]
MRTQRDKESIIAELRTIHAEPLGANEIPEDITSQLLLFVSVYSGNDSLGNVHFRDSTALTSSQIKKCLPKKLGRAIKEIEIVCKESDENNDYETLKNLLTHIREKLDSKEYKKLKKDEDITDNTCKIFAGEFPYIALRVDLDNILCSVM